MKEVLHSKKTDSILRLIAAAGLVVIIIRMITDYLFCVQDSELSPGTFPIQVYFVMNALLCLVFVYLLFKPYRLEVMSYIAFVYCAVVLLDRRDTPLAVNLFSVGMVALYCRGLLRRHPVVKALVSAAAFIFLTLLRLRFGTDEFLAWLPDNLTQIFTFAVIFSLLHTGHELRKKAKPEPEVLRLSDYPELSDRDKEWIKLALDNTKYDTIAKEYDVTPGTVKNRMRAVYKILGVSDRLSMLVAFGKCQVE